MWEESITFCRLQCDSEGRLRSHIAEGEILPVRTGPLGGISVFGIPEMDRFYRHVLIQKHFPHHGAVAFKHCGKVLFDVFRYLGVGDVSYNKPASLPYLTENPFAKLPAHLPIKRCTTRHLRAKTLHIA